MTSSISSVGSWIKPANASTCSKPAGLGEKLVALHLLKSPGLDPPACRFEGEDDGCVRKDRKTGLRYDVADQRVYINATQHFSPVPEAVCTYQVGGYQVCGKWLKDRKKRRLELDDIRTYCPIVTSLGRTLELQREIDGLYPEAEREIVSMTGSEADTKIDIPTYGSTRRRTRRA